MSKEGYSVQLDKDSLYVSTIPLTNGFHWALIHVDHLGIATRHHWAAISIDPHGPEGYIAQSLPHGPRMKAGQQHILAYFRLPDYAPTDADALRALCAAVFPRSAPSALQNRAANLNSRTWVTHVLARLLASPQCALDVEAFVTAHSCIYGDAYARAFLFSQPYATVVMPTTPCEQAVGVYRVQDTFSSPVRPVHPEK